MPNSVVKTLTVNGTTYDLKDVDSESYAPKASPALTGTPTAPTASSGTNTTQIATTAFVQGAVSSAIGNVNSFEVSVVQSLPTTNIDPHTIYFISNSGSAGNIYDEYMYINNNWEKIGTTDVDLSGYLAKTNTTAFIPTGDYNPATKKYVDDSISGISTNLSGLNDTAISSPSNGQILKYNSTSLKWENSNFPNDFMVINIGGNQNDGYTSDKTFSEIYNHVNANKNAVCVYNHQYYFLSGYDSSTIAFAYCSVISGTYVKFEGFIITSNIIQKIGYNLYQPLPSDDNPNADGVASSGSASTYSRSDHVHPTDTSRAAVSDVLTKTNTTSYTPSADYNPATKKYVDDATASITDEKLSTGTIGNDVYYPIVGTNTSSATTKYIDSTGFKYDATSSTNGYARLYLGNGTASGTAGSKYGRLMIYGTTAYGVTLDSGSPTENRTISLPNKNGTIALTSDIQACATISEIEEMCDALGFQSVTIDTSDYVDADTDE